MSVTNTINLMNTIWQKGSAQYQERIPQATRDNVEAVRYAMLSDENVIVANEFIGSLLNNIVRKALITKIFTNPLKSLKKGKKPLGDTIEEVYTNFIKGQAFDETGANLLKRNLPDVKTVYHRMNYKQTYPVTISQELLQKAFRSWENLEAFINDIINKLYTSAELDEFINMKKALSSAIEKNAVVVKEIADPLASEANAKEFIKVVKTYSRMMTFPSDAYNAYLTAQSKDDKPITTLTSKEEQVLILDAVTDVSVSVDVLASLFNMSVAEFNDTKKIVIDAFPDDPEGGKRTCAMLIDDAFLQFYDDFFVFKKFENGLGLYDNYYLHVAQTQAFSILVNAVAFQTPVTNS